MIPSDEMLTEKVRLMEGQGTPSMPSVSPKTTIPKMVIATRMTISVPYRSKRDIDQASEVSPFAGSESRCAPWSALSAAGAAAEHCCLEDSIQFRTYVALNLRTGGSSLST